MGLAYYQIYLSVNSLSIKLIATKQNGNAMKMYRTFLGTNIL